MPSDHEHHHHHPPAAEPPLPRPGEHAAHAGHEIHAAEPEPGPAPAHHDHHAMMIADFRRRFWISLLITLPILALSPMIQHVLGLRQALAFPGDLWALFVLSTAVYLYGGWPFLSGLVSELKARAPGMMTLIGVAISTAYVYSVLVVFGLKGEVFFWELATLVDIMLLGHWIEMRSVLGASRALESLARLMPNQAHRLEDGAIRDVPLNDLQPGDLVLVRPGEKVPADGRVEEGRSDVNQALLTGESLPVPKGPGEEVIGGSVNGSGSLQVRVEKTGRESFLSQVIDLVRRAQESRSRTQTIADRAAFWLVLVALAGGLLTLLAWTLVFPQTFNFALTRAVTVMVIACPHALGLAIPLVVAVSTALSASRGLLIRDRNAFENARNLQAVIFDKTGTLTLGQFGVSQVISFDPALTGQELLKYAAAVETHSEHPIARGITAAAKGSLEAKEFAALPGQGARGQVDGHEVLVVSPGYLHQAGIAIPQDERLTSAAATTVFVLVDGQLRGAIALGDVIREESREAVARLKQMGIQPMMLTGDNRQVAQWVAQELGLEEFFAEVSPDQKAAKVREVQSRGLVTAMVGDGINDAPALAQADVGIAIGAGTEVAAETAGVILVRNNPLDVVTIVSLAKATYRKMTQNLAWATGYNVIAIPLAAGVAYAWGILLSPALGAVFMSLSTVIVAINARFLRVDKDGLFQKH